MPQFSHLGRLFWHVWSTLGDHFGTSGPTWRTMGAAVRTRGGPEQDFHRFSFEEIRDPLLKVFLAPRLEIPILFRACFQVVLFIASVEMWTLGAPQVFAWKVLQNTFFTEVFYMTFEIVLYCFSKALGRVCLVFATLETGSKINGFLVM